MIVLHCLIVDDEPPAQEVLRNYIHEISWLELHAVCDNAIEAMDTYREQQIDLIFLDINMPKLSGIMFARSLENPPMIIFTTAYPEYAVEGFEVNAIDYLVKPIAFERFLKAVNKARDHFELKQDAQETKQQEFIILKSDKKIYKINDHDILYVQSVGDYMKVHTSDKVIIAAETLKNIEKLLGDQFVRIHKSYLVSINQINFIEGNQVKIKDQFLPIGLTYKEGLMEKLKTKNK